MKFGILQLEKWGGRGGVFLLCCCTLGGYFGALSFALDLLVHFRLQYLIVSALGVLLFAVRRRLMLVLFSLLCLSVNLWECLPYLPASQHPANEFVAARKIFFANVDINNRDFASMLALVNSEKPDVAVFTEVDEEWAKNLGALKESLPYALEKPAPHKFGMVLYSREEFREQNVYEFPGMVFPSVVFDITLGDPQHSLRLFAAHSAAPLSRAGYDLRNNLFDGISKIIAQAPADKQRSIVLVGDLNITPWSHFFRKFLSASGLHDSRIGRGIMPTWPLNFLPLVIPIDHCLSGKAETVADFRVTKDFGSDHRAIVCDVVN